MRLSSGPILCACVACLCLAGCKKDQDAAAPPAARPARVAVVTPHKLELGGSGRRPRRGALRQPGRLRGRRTADLARCRHRLVVTKGQKLAALSATDFQNKVIAAEADLATAKADARTRWRPGGARSRPGRQGLHAAIRLRRIAEVAAERRGGRAGGRCAASHRPEPARPHPAACTERWRRHRDRRRPGAGRGGWADGRRDFARRPSARRSSPSPARMSRVPTPGMPVKVWLQAQPDVAVTGSVREISPVADSTTGTYEVKVALPSALPGDAARRHRRRPRRIRGPGSHHPAGDRAPAIRRRTRRSGSCPRTTRFIVGR